MTAAVTKPLISRAFPGLMVLGAVAALIAGVALTQRGPDPAFLSEMAKKPVLMQEGRPLYVQRYEVTVADWNRCAIDGWCDLTLRTRPDQDPQITPATGLSYIDVQQYLAWINKRSRHDFRLPTVREWAAIAADVLPEVPEPLFTDPSLTWASSYLAEGLPPRALKPQGSFSTSSEGVADLDGSVWEWTMECYSDLQGGVDPDRCPAFFVGGEHIAAMSYLVRDPARGGCAVGSPPAHLGMRLVSDRDV